VRLLKSCALESKGMGRSGILWNGLYTVDFSPVHVMYLIQPACGRCHGNRDRWGSRTHTSLCCHWHPSPSLWFSRILRIIKKYASEYAASALTVTRSFFVPASSPPLSRNPSQSAVSMVWYHSDNIHREI
jgi:hypothetical protein